MAMSCSSGGGLGPDSVAGIRNSMVFVPLEYRLADPGDVAADHPSAPTDCAAETEYLGRNHHSRGVPCRRFRHDYPWLDQPVTLMNAIAKPSGIRISGQQRYAWINSRTH